MIDLYSRQRSTLLKLFERAVEAVSARAAMPEQLPNPSGRVLVAALGKAAPEMMHAALDRITRPVFGLVVTPAGHLVEGDVFPDSIEVIEAGHPVPTEASVRAAERALALAGMLSAEDHLLALLSGGGSALCAAPAPGVTLRDKQAVTRALLASGAPIAEINCVRKHLSRIKGGRLAAAAGAAQVTTLIISDTPGDDPALVASGPTVFDETTLADARGILSRHGIQAPATVVAALADPANETPRLHPAETARHQVAIIARARDALDAAEGVAHDLGFAVTNLGDRLEGEARTLANEHAALARRVADGAGPRIIISGGESTVIVRNPQGRGGRNLEYLLALAIALDSSPGICALACDTDGVDGTEKAAGAVVTPDTLTRARALGLDPQAHLRDNNSYLFFEALDDLIVTGPTRTNVNDFRAILIDPEGVGGC